MRSNRKLFGALASVYTATLFAACTVASPTQPVDMPYTEHEDLPIDVQPAPGQALGPDTSPNSWMPGGEIGLNPRMGADTSPNGPANP